MANEVIKTVSAETLSALLKDAGYRVSQTEQNGVTQLLSAAQGIGFALRLGNKQPGSEAEHIDFSFGCLLRTEGVVPAELVDSWNRTKRFCRLAKFDQFLALEMDVTVAGGVVRDYLRANVELWDRLLQEFILHLRQPLPTAAAGAAAGTAATASAQAPSEPESPADAKAAAKRPASPVH
jgi:hypothetical protein